MGVVTVTELESIDRCGWQHDFNSLHRQGLESANPLRSLGLGTLWHKTLDSLAQKQSMAEPHAFDLDPKSNSLCRHCGFGVEAHMSNPFQVHAGALTLKIRNHYQETTGRPVTQLEMKPAFDTIATCKTMLDNYLAYYKGRLVPEEYEYIKTEQQFFKVLPNTNHCTCYLKPKCSCQVVGQKSCRYKYGYYAFCRCNVACTCREDHILEGTLDGILRHIPTGQIDILENKTFTYHPNVRELRRTSQFMGYKWMGLDLGVQKLLYNGAWVRTHIPDGYNKEAGRKWNTHDLFSRHIVEWEPYEINTWAEQAATSAMRVFDPRYTPKRSVHPVGGCNGTNQCSYKTLCDARFSGSSEYNRILKNEYRKRPANQLELINE